jgi:hypothetical protein
MAIYNKAITSTSEGSSDKLDSGSGDRAVTTIIVCNTGVSDRTLSLYAVPSPGTTASSSNMIVNALTIPAGDTVSFDQEKLVLGTNDEVRAICSGSGLTATVSTLPV